LLVDDDKLMRTSLRGFLEAKGFTVEEAADGSEGLKKALELKPDLIVSDVKMPNTDGLQMLEKLRADEAGKQARVIILSNDETANSLNGALQAGVTVYLSKANVPPEEMVEQIVIAAG